VKAGGTTSSFDGAYNVTFNRVILLIYQIGPGTYLEDPRADVGPIDFYQFSKLGSQSFASLQSLTQGLGLIMEG
jgi:hypothetical protein